jgi:hypothetical protein
MHNGPQRLKLKSSAANPLTLASIMEQPLQIKTASGEFLDSWAEMYSGSIERRFIRLPFLQGLKEFVFRQRRFTCTGLPIPWFHREELDAELRERMKEHLKSDQQ